MTSTPTDLLRYASEIAAAYVSNNAVPVSELPAAIKDIYATLCALSGGAAELAALKPAVPIKKSVTDDYVVCLEDGKKLKVLKRYLRSNYGMTTDEYRSKWGLPADYPMVAPSYASRRSELAKQSGLGTNSSKTPRRAHA